MMVVCFLAAILFAAFGNWWLALGFWAAGLIIGAHEVRAEGIGRSVNGHPSQLRRRQLDDIARKQQVR